MSSLITTNAKIDSIANDLEILIGWAKADAEGSDEANAKHQAADDRERVKNLQQALALVKESYRN